MSEQLKPCPFCGGVPEIERTIVDFTIRCGRCDATIGRKSPLRLPMKEADARAQNQAIAAWNRRAESNHAD